MFSASVPRQAYTGNGITTVFAVPFEFRESTDLLVLRKNTTTEEVTELVLDTDYTISGGDSESGFLTMTVAPTALQELTIIDNPAAVQETEIEEGAEFPSEDVEFSLDRIGMVARRAKDLSSRSIHASDADPADVELELPSAEERASSFLAFDSSGNPIASDGGIDPAVPVSVFAATLLDDANAAAARTTLGAQQVTDGLSALGAVPAQGDKIPIYDISGAAHLYITVAQVLAALQVPTAAKTSTYGILASDSFLTGDTDSAAFTMTLPDCASNPGKVYRIKKVGTTFATANVLTIAAAGSDTIFTTVSGGTSTTLHTPGEEIEIISMGGTVWQLINRRIPQVGAAYTPTYSGVGTVTNSDAFWSRDGKFVDIYGTVDLGTTAGSQARISIPSNLTIATTGWPTSAVMYCGRWVLGTAISNNIKGGVLQAGHGNAYVTFSADDYSNAISPLTALNGNAVLVTAATIHFTARFPITGWNG